MSAGAAIYWIVGAAAGAGGAVAARAAPATDSEAAAKARAVAWPAALGGAGCVAVGTAGAMSAGVSWRTAMAAVCVLWGSAVVRGDVQQRRVSLWVNWGAIVSVCAVMAAAAAGGGEWGATLRAAAAGAGWGSVMEALSVWKPDAVGGADARTGAWAVAVAVWSLGLADAAAAVAVVHLLAAGVTLATRQRNAPFAAWLAALAVVCAVLGAATGSG